MKYILILSLFLLFGCKSQQNFDLNKDTVLFNDFGKICLNNLEILSLSKEAKINKKYLTSAFYSENGHEKVCYPINDKTFDYSDLEMLLGKKVNIYYKIYSINNKEIKVIYNITQ